MASILTAKNRTNRLFSANRFNQRFGKTILATTFICCLSALLTSFQGLASERTNKTIGSNDPQTFSQNSEERVAKPQESENALTEKQLSNSLNDTAKSSTTEEATNQSSRSNPWLFLHQYFATYIVYSDNDKLGTATRALTFSDQGWKLQMTTRLKKWMLSLKSNEFSEFNIKDNELKTRHFYTSSKVTFKSARIIEQFFNWTEKVEKGTRDKNRWELPIESQMFDRMSHLVQLRADLLSGSDELAYLVSYKGGRKSYLYRIEGKETLKTALGEIESLKIVRIKGDDSKFSIWLSPEHNYFPVRIAQIEQDKPDVVMEVSSFEYRGNKAIPSDLAVKTKN